MRVIACGGEDGAGQGEGASVRGIMFALLMRIACACARIDVLLVSVVSVRAEERGIGSRCVSLQRRARPPTFERVLIRAPD